MTALPLPLRFWAVTQVMWKVMVVGFGGFFWGGVEGVVSSLGGGGGPHAVWHPTPEDPQVAALRLSGGITSPKRDIIARGFGEEMPRADGGSGAEPLQVSVLGGDAELRGRAWILPQMASVPLCSALNPSGTLAPRVCCKSPGLEAPISPTAALGPKTRGSEQRRYQLYFDRGPRTLLRTGSRSLALSPGCTAALGRMRVKGWDVATPQPCWDRFWGSRVGFSEKRWGRCSLALLLKLFPCSPPPPKKLSFSHHWTR